MWAGQLGAQAGQLNHPQALFDDGRPALKHSGWGNAISQSRQY